MRPLNVISTKRDRLVPATLASLVIAGAAVVLLIRFIAQIEQGVTGLVSLLPLGYAYGAGMVASLNPCGFLMLPALVGYYLGSQMHDAPDGILQRLGRGGLLAVSATGGFIVLFTLVGTLISFGGRALAEYFPVGGLLVGVGLVATGAWLLLSGSSLGISAASRVHKPLGSSASSLFLFGVAYGVASLGCTLPVFLVVVAGSLTAQGVLAGAINFVAYALGMGTVLALVVAGAVFFQDGIARFLRGMVPYIHRLSAAFLLGAGMYLIYYWTVSNGNVFN
ncbi:MAG: hypothetical protein M5U01_37455 [Ardenticatenaceae bacterium]|nr:hypothetical protein [Ardenticatenaceae bacterium]